jgi:hypothetical protein
MQLEGNFPEPEERDVRSAVVPVGAGLRPARLHPLPAGEGRGEGASVPVPVTNAVIPSEATDPVPNQPDPSASSPPNPATLHSSLLSLPATLPVSRRASIEAGPASPQVVEYPNNLGERLDPARFSPSRSDLPLLAGEDSSLLFLSDAEE